MDELLNLRTINSVSQENLVHGHISPAIRPTRYGQSLPRSVSDRASNVISGVMRCDHSSTGVRNANHFTPDRFKTFRVLNCLTYIVNVYYTPRVDTAKA